MKRTIWIFAILATVLTACRPASGAKGFVTVDPEGVISLAVGQTLDLAAPVSAFRLTDYYEEVGMILPGDDPQTFLEFSDCSTVDDESLLAHSFERVIRVSLKDGAFQCEYGRQGRGPREFVQAVFCYAQDGEVYVNDMMSVCHVYAAADGSWLRDIPLSDEPVMFNNYTPLGGGLGILCYSSNSGKEQMFDIVDAGGAPVRRGSLPGNNKRTTPEEGIRIYNASRMDGSRCVTTRQGEIYKVGPGEETLWIRQDPGQYSFIDEPWLSTGIYPAGRFFFASISKEGSEGVVAVYDLDARALVLRDADGVPYERDGQQMHLRPIFSDNGILIFADSENQDNYYCFKQLKR